MNKLGKALSEILFNSIDKLLFNFVNRGHTNGAAFLRGMLIAPVWLVFAFFLTVVIGAIIPFWMALDGAKKLYKWWNQERRREEVR